jgi:hypothetical protein
MHIQNVSELQVENVSRSPSNIRFGLVNRLFFPDKAQTRKNFVDNQSRIPGNTDSASESRLSNPVSYRHCSGILLFIQASWCV